MKKKLIISPLVIFLAVILFQGCQQKKVNYLNESMKEKTERMAWWEEARFGMFIHWGLYAIPAGEWNGETNHAEWIRTTAHIPLEVYDGFVNEFNPVNYDPEAWVKMAKDAGMKYIVITSKHHDGFCLFDSEYTDFDVMSTPYGKDLLKSLADACHREGIRICWYHSIMDWHHPDYLPRRGWETDRSPEGADYERYIQYMKNQLEELVVNYGDIGVLWFDGEWEGTWSNEYGKDLYNYVRNLRPEIIINNRVDVGRSGMAGLTRSGEYAGDFGTPEQEIPATGLPGVYWETCMTMNDHWGYNKNDKNWKSTGDLIQKLADIASKGGNFLLNVGPKADGTFPEESTIRLRQMGEWMEVNGASIYGTTASPFEQLEWGRCTWKETGEGAILYLHVFDWPEDNLLVVPGIFNDAKNSYLLADIDKKPLKIVRNEDALIISLPDQQPDSINSVVVLKIAGLPDVSHPPAIKADYDIFIDSLIVVLDSDRENVEIRYTMDGTLPGIESTRYDEPIVIYENTTLSARCFRDGKPVSDSTAHTFTKVDPMNPVFPDNLIAGSIARYFEGNWDSVPDFGQLKPLKELITANFVLDSKIKDEYYGFLFEGFIKIDKTGIYRFYTDSDDGSNLYINNLLVVDNDGLHGMQMAFGTVPLKVGYYMIRVEYFEKSGGDDLKVTYQGPGIKQQPIPDELLFTVK
jgi:alpha-L-fucosidase